jgi:hypothetical protein
MTATERRAVGDMKQGLTGAKPKLSILPRVAQTYQTRGTEYGADKYARGNYHGPPPPTVTPAERLLGYIDATMRHLTKVSDAMNRALGTGGDLAAAACTRDTDTNGDFPASNLPDLAHAIASLGIGITCAADDGLIPEDPGRPWDAARTTTAIPQKDDPAAERRRVGELGRRAADQPIRGPGDPGYLACSGPIGPRFVVVPADEVGDRPAEYGSRDWCTLYAGYYSDGYLLETWSPVFYSRDRKAGPDKTHAIVDTRPQEGYGS